jgi:RNA polymerase sigma-70 factor (ECF subfamily)
MSPRDAERLTHLVTERAAALALYARQWLDATGAEDAVQEALAALVDLRRPPESPLAWMYRAVRNAAIDELRAATRRRRREQSVAVERRELFVDQPEALLDAEIVAACLQRLSLDQREIVVLRIWGELGFAEIAEVMRLAISTVHQRYHLALRRMRSMLEKPCEKSTS